MHALAPQAPGSPDAEVATESRGDLTVVTCSVCGQVSTHSITAAAQESMRWHQARHAGTRTIHLTLTPLEMRQLATLARERAQDPENVVREILSHALDVASIHPHTPRPPRLRMVG